MKRSLIIADDFTGANDTGLQLKRKGYKTKVVFRYKGNECKDSCYVIDTETRNMTEEEACRKVGEDVANVCYEDFDYVIKKIDSTMRGNIAAEIKLIDQMYHSEMILFMPALPDMGRTTVDGVQLLDGIPLMQTELANDPKKPVKEDRIADILKQKYSEVVTHISLQDIRNNGINFDEGRIFTCDAETNEDMMAVLHQVVALKKKVLYVGTASVAEALLENVESTKPSIALIASLSSVTRGQVLYAEQQGIPIVKIPIYELLRGTMSDKYVNAAVDYLKEGKDVIVLSSASYDRKEYDKTLEVAKCYSMNGPQVSDYTQMCMGEIGKQILDEVAVSGVLLAGGDTAISLFDKLEADGSEVLEEVAITLPLLELVGGDYKGLRIITKAGAFGKEDAISYGLRKLKEQI